MEVIIKGDKWSKMELKGEKGQMFEPSKSFTDLVVWQRAHEFVLDVYKVTKTFPVEERFALCSQFQRLYLPKERSDYLPLTPFNYLKTWAFVLETSYRSIR